MKRKLDLFEYNDNDGVGRLRTTTPSQEIAIAEKLEANMMTKAEFNALAEERKANRAGSGFDEWGVYNATGSATTFFGSGTSVIGFQNMAVPSMTGGYWDGTFFNCFGKNSSSIISGVTHKHLETSAIRVPPAPHIYPHDTVLTPEQIASGVIKHADASNSGLIVNGKFDVDTSGWTVGGASAGISWDNGKLKVVVLGAGYGWAYQSIPTIIGKKYIITYDVDITSASPIAYARNSSGVEIARSITKQGKNYILEFIATTSTTMIAFGNAVVNTTNIYDNISVYPADAISRSDLVFLESWHEDISEKNFVYPLGNVQYLGGNTDGLTGIANGAFTGFEQYSLFGNWQTPSALIGKGYVWSSLTEAQKRAFIANPENNCYLDGNKTIQVRYRVRVVQGWGDSYYADGLLYYSNSTGRVYTNNDWLKPKGKLVNITSDLASYSVNETGYYSKINTIFLQSTEYSSDYGILVAISKADNAYEVNTSYSGRNFAILLASVHRRNQGMYHPVYNPNGTKKASDGSFWYNTAVSFTNILDCFDPAKLLTASGYIGTVSGRPDGLFYDQVHESDILDLRNSSKKVEDYNRLISREFNKLVAGTNRGKEGEIFTEIKTQTTTGTVATIEVNYGTKYKSGDTVYVYDLTTSAVKGRFTVISISSNTLTVDTAFAKLANSYMISGASSTRTKSNTILVCDVIGNPANYPSHWKANEGAFTTLHTAEDGTSLLPDGARDTFKLSRKANATPLLCLRSTDSGATWASFTPTFSTITNEITLTDEPAGNLVMVYYQTHTSMAVPVANSEVVEIGEVIGTNGLANGALISTLIGKVPTANTAPYLQIGYDVSGYRMDMSTFKFSTTSTEVPTHSALSLAGGASGVPAVKVFPYLTRRNGKAYLNLVFKEMKYNGTSWGDDSKFNIVNNLSTTTDNNAQTVLIGQKTVELPYFIAGDE